MATVCVFCWLCRHEDLTHLQQSDDVASLTTLAACTQELHDQLLLMLLRLAAFNLGNLRKRPANQHSDGHCPYSQ